MGSKNQTHCKRGHEFNVKNTYVRVDKTRVCRVCRCGYGINVKLEVLAHYSPNGILGCSWSDCGVSDSDMLTLDHINNDGANARRYTKIGSGNVAYWFLKRHGYPKGYQTLCWNHQWKKRIGNLKECHGK